jgi:hypothetical protein
MAAVDLPRFLDDIALAGWQWGERDCLLWLGLWSRELTGIDGGAEWRGRYRTALGCTRVLKRSGGMVACIKRGADVAGLARVETPQAGDIGLVPVLTNRGVGEAGAIFTGKRWALLTSRGIMTTPAEPAMMWGVP